VATAVRVENKPHPSEVEHTAAVDKRKDRLLMPATITQSQHTAQARDRLSCDAESLGRASNALQSRAHIRLTAVSPLADE
jgi:hypothetical protein